MTQPRPRRFPLPVRAAARGAVIAGFLAVLAIGGVATALAATRTVETSAILELRFWVAPEAPAAFVSTRQQGAEWSTHDYLVLLRESPEDDGLLVSDPVNISVPVSVEVEAAPPPVFVAAMAAAPPPTIPLGKAPGGRASCCTVRGMWDQRSAQRAVAAEMREVISFAKSEFGLTHEGPITINIAYTEGGLNVRYREAFGESLEELPSTCSFQRERHIFIGPECRTDGKAIAREWFIRAVKAPYVPARWVGVATFEYYWFWYQHGEPPTVRDDRYRSAIFHQLATDFRAGRPHEDLMAAAMLFAVESYGDFDDWLGLYEAVLDGAPVHEAFEEAFGVEMVRFYAEFEAWAARERSNMLSLAYGSCREAARYLVARSLEDGGGFPDFRVPLEYDHDADGYVCEGFASFAQEDLICVVAGEDG